MDILTLRFGGGDRMGGGLEGKMKQPRLLKKNAHPCIVKEQGTILQNDSRVLPSGIAAKPLTT